MSKLENLRVKVAHQQEEIGELRGVVQDLRSSLQLSDAQNLALQVLLRKVARAEGQLVNGEASSQSQHQAASSVSTGLIMPGSLVGRHAPGVTSTGAAGERRSAFRARMDESERQLENLVRELKEMSQVRYPTLQQGTQHHHNGVLSSSNNNNQGTASSSASTTNVYFANGGGGGVTGTDEVDAVSATRAVGDLEERLDETAAAIGGARTELVAAEAELGQTAERLRKKDRDR